jgi:selenocysteine-specific elongation factor
MLAGVGPVPAAMIVVAADEGWRRQSTEHVAALAALGVSHGLLVISRADLADPGPARQQALAELDRTPLRGIEAVAVSAVTGAGVDEVRAGLDRLVAGLPPPDVAAPVRLWVDRAFTMRGSGTVVTGTLPAGSVAVGDELSLVPGDRLVRVRGVQSLGEPHQRVAAVARVALNLRGIERDVVFRGSALITPGAWVQSSLIDVQATDPDGVAIDDLPGSLVLHVGSAAVAVRTRPLSAGLVRLRLDRPLPLRPGDRGLLRDPGRHAVAAGVQVLDVDPPELRGSGAARRRAGDLAGPLDPVTEVRRRVLTSRAELDRLGILAAGEPLPAGLQERAGSIVADLDWQIWTTRLREVVTAAADELAGGLSEAEVARRVGLPEVALVRPLAQAAGLVAEQGRVRPPGAQVQLPAPAMRLLTAWQGRWAQEPFAAPEGAELAAAGLDARRLAAAERAGLIVRLRDGIILSPDAPEEAVRRLAALPQPFTASQARTALGTTRRVAIPLLEHLDANRRTRRGEDMTRVIVR